MAETVKSEATGDFSGEEVHKTDAEWRELLTPEQFYVLRQKGTERAFTGPLYENHADGVYHCAGCGCAAVLVREKKSSLGRDGRVFLASSLRGCD